jgi:hypothetical protein
LIEAPFLITIKAMWERESRDITWVKTVLSRGSTVVSAVSFPFILAKISELRLPLISTQKTIAAFRVPVTVSDLTLAAPFEVLIFTIRTNGNGWRCRYRCSCRWEMMRIVAIFSSRPAVIFTVSLPFVEASGP